jgi:hypothetical protein
MLHRHVAGWRRGGGADLPQATGAAAGGCDGGARLAGAAAAQGTRARANGRGAHGGTPPRRAPAFALECRLGRSETPFLTPSG